MSQTSQTPEATSALATGYPSAGARQRLAGTILKNIRDVRETLDRIERGVESWDADAQVINGCLLQDLSERAGIIVYRVGMANGSVVTF